MKRLIVSILVVLLFSGLGGSAISSEEGADVIKALRTGDIIFQALGNELSEVISSVTNSPLSHCGMVIRDETGVIKVIEAVGPVRITPVNDFIDQGIDRKYAVIRPKKSISANLDTVIAEAKKFLGRPYDFLYKFDDEYIYCSELVYKAYLNASKVKIAKPVKLGELNYEENTDFIKSLTGGDLPLDREMVTPIDVYNSDKFDKIFSDFPE